MVEVEESARECWKYVLNFLNLLHKVYLYILSLRSNVFPQQEILLAIKIILFVLYMVIWGFSQYFMGPPVQQQQT